MPPKPRWKKSTKWVSGQIRTRGQAERSQQKTRDEDLAKQAIGVGELAVASTEEHADEDRGEPREHREVHVPLDAPQQVEDVIEAGHADASATDEVRARGEQQGPHEQRSGLVGRPFADRAHQDQAHTRELEDVSGQQHVEQQLVGRRRGNVVGQDERVGHEARRARHHELEEVHRVADPEQVEAAASRSARARIAGEHE